MYMNNENIIPLTIGFSKYEEYPRYRYSILYKNKYEDIDFINFVEKYKKYIKNKKSDDCTSSLILQIDEETIEDDFNIKDNVKCVNLLFHNIDFKNLKFDMYGNDGLYTHIIFTLDLNFLDMYFDRIIKTSDFNKVDLIKSSKIYGFESRMLVGNIKRNFILDFSSDDYEYVKNYIKLLKFTEI